MKIIFATHNKNKFEEVKKMVSPNYELVSLYDLNYLEEIPEIGKTLEENALIKANTIFKKFKITTIADDSGLEIETLNNEPGVYSARYAGEQANAENNMNLVLEKLKNIKNRKATFKTVIAFVTASQTEIFKGEITGTITHDKKGNNGFGYDPIFIPNDKLQTFGEMCAEDKRLLSHRSIAIQKWINFLNSNPKSF